MKRFDLWLADILFLWAYKLIEKHTPPISEIVIRRGSVFKPTQQQERTLH